MNVERITGVAGSGAMGSGIAMVAAKSGWKVMLMDVDQSAIEKSRAFINNELSKLVKRNKITESEAGKQSERINFTTKIEDFSDCDIVIEAVVENLDIKKELFKSIEKVVSGNCILATNTSSLAIVAIAAACKNPGRVVGIHFFNPAAIMPLVEIIPALTTSDEVLSSAKNIIDSWGKVTVVAKDTPGFIVNRIARPFYSEAIKMVEEGIADMVTVDWAMKEFGGFKMGPFELMDFIGNDVNYNVTVTVWEQLFFDPRYRPSITQKRLFEAGWYGRKSGRGYYSYEEHAVVPEPDKNETKGRYIFERILSMLINEAADAVYLNIASRDDIELAMTKGVNYPKGLLKWADEFGIGKVLEIMNRLMLDYNDDRYRPSLILKKMNAEVTAFYSPLKQL